jgi:hypothetical protein
MNTSTVSCEFTALHFDPHMQEGWHEHTFTVEIERGSDPWTDGRSPRSALAQFLATLAPLNDDGRCQLPEALWSNEAIAQAVLALNNVARATVSRPGFSATATREKTGPAIYLCGPINGCTDAEAKDWREHVKGLWPGSCIDPMRRDYRGREGVFTREIVELDKIDVAASDVILRDGSIEAKEAVEVNNTAGKIISTVKLELANAALCGFKPSIPFLGGDPLALA